VAYAKTITNPRVFNLLYEYLREQEKEEQHYEQLSLWK
jgi:hypothetical protein